MMSTKYLLKQLRLAGHDMRRLEKTAHAGCGYCGRPMVVARASGNQKQGPDARTLQHVLPRRQGGRTIPENLRWACAACNGNLGSVGDCPGALAAWLSFAPDGQDWHTRKGWLRRQVGALLPEGLAGTGRRFSQEEFPRPARFGFAVRASLGAARQSR